MRTRAALTALTTALASAAASIGISMPAHAIVLDCGAVDSWSTLSQCFSDANGDTSAPTEVTLSGPVTAGSGQSLAVPSWVAITLDLAGNDLTITSPDTHNAAVRVPVGTALTIEDTSASSTAELTATGGASSAGIGGSKYESSGTITINGGTINATGNLYASGIGGGQEGNGGITTINGGTITATAGAFAAGIGGGDYGNGGTIAINGGTITATGGNKGPGIGGGYGSSGGSITIETAATVTATAGSDGPTAVGHGQTGTFGSLSNAGTLTIATGSTLVIPSGKTVTNTGTILGAVSGTVTVNNYPLTFDHGATNFGATTTPDIRIYAPTLTAAGVTLPQPPTGNTGTWAYTPTTGPNADTPVTVTATTNLNTLFGDNPTSAQTLTFVPGTCTAETWTDLKACVASATGTPTTNPTHITLAASITAGADTYLTVPVGKAISLDLAGHDLTIETPGSNQAAIRVPAGAALTVDDTSTPSTGTLTVVGGLNGGTGIGGTSNVDSGTITINGGTINATGGPGGAGIGGGSFGDNTTIAINGGTVNATGGVTGAGIGGGGFGGNGGTISIGTDAIVTVTNGEDAPNAIGSGNDGTSFGTLTIDGHLTVTSNSAITIPSGTTVTTTGHIVNRGAITNNGTLAGTGQITNTGTIKNTGTIPGLGHGGDPAGTALLITDKHYDIEFDVTGTGLDPIAPFHLYAPTIAAGGQELPAPTRTGYTFKGWFDGTTSVTDTTTLSGTGPRTVSLTPKFLKTQTLAWPTLPTDPKVGDTWSPVFNIDDEGTPVTLTASSASDKNACTVAAGVITYTKAGTCELTATRPGDTTYDAVSATVELTISKTTRALTLTPSTTTPVFSAPVSVSASLDVNTAGSVSFTLDGEPITSTDTTVTLPTTLPVGAHTIGATFTPTDTTTYTGSTASTSITIAAAATTTTLAVTGTTVTATVAPVAPATATPTGIITFSVGGAVVDTISLTNGVAVYNHNLSTAQTHALSAVYTPADTTFTGSSASTARSNPSLVAKLSSPPNAAGWHRSPVTITYTCTITSAPLVDSCPAPVTVNRDGRALTTTATITATDGGTTTVVTSVNIDRTNPTLAITSTTRNNGYPAITCTASDAVSGLARGTSCRLTTQTKGNTTHWRATATDNAGNTTTRTGHHPHITAWIRGARTGPNAYPRLKAGQRYTLIARRTTKPSFYKPASKQPTIRVRSFTRIAPDLWAVEFKVTKRMLARNTTWNVGISTRTEMETFRFRIKR